MPENTNSYLSATDALARDDEHLFTTPSPEPRCKVKRAKGPKYPPDKDLELWLTHNAPVTFQELVDIRYSLYHRCSRSDFKILQKRSNDYFTLSGRHSEVTIINDKARHYLLWKLRLLGRANGWRRALPGIKKRGRDTGVIRQTRSSRARR
jgi:hypothetical protein